MEIQLKEFYYDKIPLSLEMNFAILHLSPIGPIKNLYYLKQNTSPFIDERLANTLLMVLCYLSILSLQN